jgi:selenocysteine lyase/cysteine desulfurase
VAAARTPHTRLIAMSHVPCETGTRLPAKAVCAWAAENDILSLFDGAQSWGAFPIDLKDMGCDFYAMNGHKWMCGPKGTGFFYARKEKLVELRPAHVGAGSLEVADPMTGRAEPFKDGRRFEVGSRGWGILAGMDASLDWFDSLGWPKVHEHIAGLASYLKAQVLARPFMKLHTPREAEKSSGLTSISMEGHDSMEVATQLREQWKIYTRMVLQNSAMRLATSHFNSQADVDFLFEKLDAIHGAGKTQS